MSKQLSTSTRRKASLITGAILFATGLVAATAMPASAALSWGTSSTAVSDQSTGITTPVVALSQDGKKAVAIWRIADGNNQILQSSIGTVSGTTSTWSTPVTVGTLGTSLSYALGGNPTINISDDGTRALVAFTTMDPTTDGHGKAAVMDLTAASPTWSTPVDVTATADQSRMLVGALSRDGSTAVFTWKRFNPLTDFNTSWAARSASVTATSITLDAEKKVSSSLGAAGGPAQISSDGKKAIVFTSRSSTFYSLTADITAGVATWGTAQAVLTSGTESLVNGDARMSADGSTVLFFASKSAGGNANVVSFVGTRGSNTMTWAAPTDVSTPASSSSNGTPTFLSVSGSLTLGSVIATWRTTPNSSNVAYYSSGSLSGSNLTMQAPTAYEASANSSDNPAVAVSSDGKTAAAIWSSTTNSATSTVLSSASISAGVATWATPSKLTETGNGSLQASTIAISSDGAAAVALFSSSDGAGKLRIRAVGFGTAPATTTTTTVAPATAAATATTAAPSAGASGAATTTVASSKGTSQGGLVVTDTKVYTTAPTSVPSDAAIRVLTSAESKTAEIVSQTPNVCVGASTNLVFVDTGTCTAQVVSVSTKKVLRTLRTKVVPSTVTEMKVGNAVVTLAPIYFFNGTTDIRPGGAARLSSAATLAKKASSVLVIGHTGNLTGNTPANKSLSTARAKLVAARLTALGTKSVKTIGLGALAPVTSGQSAAAQDRNRRVIVVLVP